jgi:hypothetical protein
LLEDLRAWTSDRIAPRDSAVGFLTDIGVGWNKSRGKWQARVRKGRNTSTRFVWSAYFDDLEEAARARDAKALEVFRRA